MCGGHLSFTKILLDLELLPESTPDQAWPFSLQVTPHTKLCMTKAETLFMVIIDGDYWVVSVDVSLVEDTVDNIELTSSAEFYSDAWSKTSESALRHKEIKPLAAKIC